MRLPEEYARYLGLGAEIAAVLALPVLGGYLVDQWLDISPYGILIGSLIGLILFFLDIIRIANELNEGH